MNGQQKMPANSYDHTYTDAWQSGTGGKALVISKLGVSVLGGITGKDVSELKSVINNATSNLVSNESFNHNDISNWVGAMLCTGEELIQYHRNQEFEEEVRRLTDASTPGYDPEKALAVAEIDKANRRIIWKSNSEWARDVINYRASQQSKWLDANLKTICDITLDEYNALSKEERQNIDIKLLSNHNNSITSTVSKSSETINISEIQLANYRKEIKNSVISKYEFNSAELSKEQIKALHKIGEYMISDSSISIKIIGHTCSVGTEKNNYNVGQKRAEEAKNYLVTQGITADRIITESAAYFKPVASNDTADGQKANRRITFEIIH